MISICDCFEQTVGKDKQWMKEMGICPRCHKYHPLSPEKRIEMLSDGGVFREWDGEIPCSNPYGDEQYAERLLIMRERYHIKEAIVCGEIRICGIRTAIGIMDGRFMMGSMGHVVGEKVARLFEKAMKKKIPVLLFCCSGGARMQEGIISLMQMEKTAAAVKRHSDAGMLYIAVLTNPTTGGVTASFASLADIILAEAGATIGFAGPRVVAQTMGEELPKGFQSAEFQLEHGFLDAIVRRETMKEELSQLFLMHKKEPKNRKTRIIQGKIEIEERARKTRENKQNCSNWEKVKVARMSERPTALDFIEKLFEQFFELHGDRCYGDDRAIIGGIASFHGTPVTVLAQQKGKKSMEDALYRNFGMPCPEGYRKALRLIKEAEKFRRPVICLIDTVGAFCGKCAEERGQGEAIARNLYELSTVTIPILSIIIGEGGSGGALALGVGNEVWMLENAVYSVLSPEGYASILWHDTTKGEEAAEHMKMTAEHMTEMEIIEKVIEEPEPLTKRNMASVCIEMDMEIRKFLFKYEKKSPKTLVRERYERFRKY
ncbi:MAG: acetyl-CoA carboxylase carboxyltransferase subunit alpha [Lachnospiraceae bacterium]|nr:acetyl-CoA carboxylase carboxyltransferase subunit alpha [Robinsoniella sp.]MDY3767851.1 acetyl-CoA carboxylase carboxyltransferase subunit alpha [Lachnospiraceae bacterium]